jgi:hypothetical protein
MVVTGTVGRGVVDMVGAGVVGGWVTAGTVAGTMVSGAGGFVALVDAGVMGG